MTKEKIIISLGGSLLFSDNFEINYKFLSDFKKVILKYISKKQFFIFVGGGKIARLYQAGIRYLKGTKEDEDKIGIEITKVNARLLLHLFKNLAFNKIIDNPLKKIKIQDKIYIGAGWKPGFSTDYDTTLLAKNLKVSTIINLTNVDYVYDKNPKEFKDAKPFKKLSWQEYEKIIIQKWQPGLSTPFDPLASKLAKKLKIKVVIINGSDLKRLDNFLKGKNFIGTIIE